MPRVSILLPTYNRAAFLPEAFASIESQSFRDWELIVVDDGSTDETPALVHEFARRVWQPVRCLRQSNQGVGAARNRLLDAAQGEYCAFLDSDDLWLPNHLQLAVESFTAVPALGWFFTRARFEAYPSGQPLTGDSFCLQNQPHPFRAMRTRRIGAVQLIDDPRSLEWAIRFGNFAGSQVSVIRRSALGSLRYPAVRVGEDMALFARFLAHGGVVGFRDDITVVYRIHAQHTSIRGPADFEKRHAAMTEFVRALESLLDLEALPIRARHALKSRIAAERFWTMGYSLLWQSGRRAEALKVFRSALRLSGTWRMWKTYWLCQIRRLLAQRGDL